MGTLAKLGMPDSILRSSNRHVGLGNDALVGALVRGRGDWSSLKVDSLRHGTTAM